MFFFFFLQYVFWKKNTYAFIMLLKITQGSRSRPTLRTSFLDTRRLKSREVVKMQSLYSTCLLWQGHWTSALCCRIQSKGPNTSLLWAMFNVALTLIIRLKDECKNVTEPLGYLLKTKKLDNSEFAITPDYNLCRFCFVFVVVGLVQRYLVMTSHVRKQTYVIFHLHYFHITVSCYLFL